MSSLKAPSLSSFLTWHPDASLSALFSCPRRGGRLTDVMFVGRLRDDITV